MNAILRTMWIECFVARMCELGTCGPVVAITEKAADLWDTRGHENPLDVADAAWPAGLPYRC